MELQNRGVSLDEIYGLSKILDLDKLGKEWHYGMGIDAAQQRQQDMISSGGGSNYRRATVEGSCSCG